MKLKITVHGVAYEVDVEVLDPGEGFPSSPPLPSLPGRSPAARESSGKEPRPAAPAGATSPAADRQSVLSPVAGTILEIHCKEGEAFAPEKVLFVLEAMKMKTSIVAPKAGRIGKILVAPGDAVQEGQALLHYD